MGGPSGAFLGGFAEGHAAADARAITREDNAADVALRTRAASLAERNAATGERNSRITEITGRIDSTMKVIGSAVEAARAAGQPPERIAAGIKDSLEDVATFSAMIGRDPSALINQVETMIGMLAAPSTDIGRLQADLRNGYIDQATFEAKSKALTTPSGTTVNVNNAGETAFAKSVGDEFGKDLVKRRQDALSAVKSLESTEQARGLLDGGVITGTGADWLLAAGKALQKVGINLAPDAIANTQAFTAARAQEVASIIRNFGAGTGLSDSDKAFAIEAAGGKIDFTEPAIRKILDINSRASRNVIRAYNADVGRSVTGMPFDLRVPEPPELAADQQPPTAAADDNPPTAGAKKKGSDWYVENPSGSGQWFKVMRKPKANWSIKRMP